MTDNTQNEESRNTYESTEQCRGWWIPIEIVDLFQSGKIKSLEMALLATVDSLVSENKGCFASNARLGAMLRVSGDRVSKMITKLKRIGLVIQVAYNGRIRHLETCWSRIDWDKASKGLKKLAENQSRTNCPVRVGENAESDTEKKPTRNRVDKLINKRGVGGQPKLPSSPSTSFFQNGKRPKSKKPNPHISAFDRKAASKLKEVLVLYDTGLARAKLETLATQICRLRTKKKVSANRIKSAVLWLKEHYQDEYTPRLYKVNDIDTKFLRIEDAMDRSESDTIKAESKPQYERGSDEEAEHLEALREDIKSRTVEDDRIYGDIGGDEYVIDHDGTVLINPDGSPLELTIAKWEVGEIKKCDDARKHRNMSPERYEEERAYIRNQLGEIERWCSEVGAEYKPSRGNA